MKKGFLQAAVLLLCMVLGGCGRAGQENSGTNGESNSLDKQEISDLPDVIINNMTGDEGYYDIQTDEKALVLSLEKGEFTLGAWYEGEEAVWLVGNDEGSVFYYKPGQEKELLLEGVSSTYVNAGAEWRRIDEDYYILSGNFLVVLDAGGELKDRIVLGNELRLQGICTTESGKIVVAVYNRSNDNTQLQELDAKTGELIEKEKVQTFYGLAKGTQDSVLVVSEEGLSSIDMVSGEQNWYMKWKGTTYDPNTGDGSIREFRLTEDGKMISLVESTTDNKWLERSLVKVSFEALGKTILVYKTSWASPEIKEVIAQFNKESADNYVYLEEMEAGTAYDDFVEQTGIEIATGKGPDIIDCSAVENIYSLAKKGVFEDLYPYMQESEMQTANYFPAAFRDFEAEGKCYGFTYGFYLNTMYMKTELAEEVSSLETLLMELEGSEDTIIFSERGQYYPKQVLYYFLRMSEDMYGMLDWENGTCDFSGELWQRMLETAKRYGMSERMTGYEGIATEVIGGTFQDFARNDLQARQQGMTALGYPTKETMVNQVYEFTLCMNAASEHKEGVWEFFAYVMGAKGQQILSKYYFSVLRSEFEEDYRAELANPSIIDVVNHEGIYTTEEQVAQIRVLLENAMQDPIRTEYVWSIISEEVGHYFSGEKTAEQVTEIIENRVNMYMAENR